MVVAARQGLLNPVKTDADRNREAIMLRQLAREMDAESLKLRFNQRLAAAQVSIDDPDRTMFKKNMEGADELYLKYMNATRPYRDWHAAMEQSRLDEERQDRETWERYFGRLDDPETQRKIDEAVEFLTNDGNEE